MGKRGASLRMTATCWPKGPNSKHLRTTVILLDLDADPGAGNLLGNLLCAVTGLLDGAGLLSDILGILDRINGILDLLNNL